MNKLKILIMALFVMGAPNAFAETAVVGTQWKQEGSTVLPADDVEVVSFTGVSTIGISGSLSGDGPHNISAVMDNTTGNEIGLSLNCTTDKAAGDDSCFVINQTDTASPGTSYIQDWQVGGASKLKLYNDGTLTIRGAGVLNLSQSRHTLAAYTPRVGQLASDDAFNVGPTGTRIASGDAILIGDHTSTASSGDVNTVAKRPVFNLSGTAKGVVSYQNISTISEGSRGLYHLEFETEGALKFYVDDEGGVYTDNGSYRVGNQNWHNSTGLHSVFGAGPLVINSTDTNTTANVVEIGTGTHTISSGTKNVVATSPIFALSGSAKGVATYQNISTISEGSGGLYHVEYETERGGVFSVDDEGKTAIGQDIASTQLHVNSNAANITAITTFENLSGDIQIFRVDASPEGVITASRGDIAIGINGNSEGALFIKHIGDASNTGWKSVTIKHEGNMHIHDNTVDTVIYTQDIPHFIFGLFSSVVEEGFTFSAGSTGPIASFSDYGGTVAGTVLATDVGHGLSSNQGITINNSADYNGAFNITVVNSDTFYFTDTFVGDETANWQKGDCLTVDAGGAGDYNVFMAGFGLGTTGGTDAFEWETMKHTPGSDPIPIENAEVKETFTGSTNPTSFTGIGSVTVADGDNICLAMIGLTGVDDFENSHISFIVKN